ncbi:hypothetical protein KA005_82325 [bacterium]|nr:hypothetical protein [bacterium]
MSENTNIFDMLQYESPNLPLGISSILLTGSIKDCDFDFLIEARRRVQNAVL